MNNEKRNALISYCNSHPKCESCELNGMSDFCFSDEFNANIDKYHSMIFGSETDTVNHPNHYCQEGSMECIDEMVAVFGKSMTMNFCLLNVWKYRKRALFKNGEEDMKKSDWYMKKYIELRDTE